MQRRIIPHIVLLNNHASLQILICYVVYQRIMLVGCFWVAVLCLRVKQKDLPILHSDDEVHIEQRLLTL